MERRHNTRHAAALAAAAAASEEGPAHSSRQEKIRRASPSFSPPSSSASSSPTPSSANAPQTTQVPTKMASKRDMYEAFQVWAMKTYGDSAKTKTVTRRKYNRILKILKGEEQTNAENSKFRFWVKAKGFRIGPPSDHTSDVKKSDQVLYIPCSKLSPGGNGKEDTVYKKVAVVENFFDIIYGVHVEMDGRGGKHAGQKRTYKAIAEMYSFLPREAVTHFLMSCADCQKRMHLATDGTTSASCGGKSSGLHSNVEQPEESAGSSSSPETPGEESLQIDYSLPITTTYLKHMRSLGYTEEDALNPEREDSDVESEVSEDPNIQSNPQVVSQHYDSQTEEGGDDGDQAMADAGDAANAMVSERALDMRHVTPENGHMHWTSDEPINMSKGDFSNSHQDHSYERTLSPYNACVKREASATPDNLSAGTKDEDDEEDDDDTDKIDINKYDPERLKAFNMFVRLFVDENLDRMVPISRQPKDKIQAIIDSCARQFPEFGERARKRIRTYLKSCRRNKRTRESSNWEMGRNTHPHLTSALAEQILASACENESQNAKRMRLGLKPIANLKIESLPGIKSPSVRSSSPTEKKARKISHQQLWDSQQAKIQQNNDAEVDRGRTSSQGNNSHSTTAADIESRTTSVQENILQATLRHGRPPHTAASSLVNGGVAYAQGPSGYPAYRLVPSTTNHCSAPTSNGHHNSVHSTVATITNGPTDLSMKKCVGNQPANALKYSLNPSEVIAVKQLIAGYRESAAFLLRSADELEQLLLQQN